VDPTWTVAAVAIGAPLTRLAVTALRLRAHARCQHRQHRTLLALADRLPPHTWLELHDPLQATGSHLRLRTGPRREDPHRARS
jgi:hypothetical protein